MFVLDLQMFGDVLLQSFRPLISYFTNYSSLASHSAKGVFRLSLQGCLPPRADKRIIINIRTFE